MSDNKKYRLPKVVPRRRSLRHAITAVHDPIPFLKSNLKHFGKTYAFYSGGMHKGILTTEPEFIQHVLQKNNRNYRKSRMQTDILGQYIGKGLLTSNGEPWLRQRRMIQPAFHRTKLDGLVTIVQDEITRFFESEWRGKGEREIYPDMHMLAFRIVARALFSADLDEAQMAKLSDEISAVQDFVVRRIRQPWMHYWYHVNGEMRKHDAISDTIRETIRGLIRHRKTHPIEANDLLDLLLSTRYEDTGEPMDEEQILDESLILFAAGHETSAVALTWTLYILSKHPEHLEQIRKEAQECSFDSLGEVMKMQYSRQVIEESMRIYPPAWMIDRMSLGEDEILDYSYPEGTFILLWLYGLHHDPDIWEDPARFDPTRFDPEERKKHAAYTYVPFGGGPRLCIGYQFAMMEMLQVLGYVALHYDVHVVEDHIKLRPLVTLHPRSNVRAIVEERQGVRLQQERTGAAVRQ